MSAPRGDRRYGCSRCTTLPGLGYLDRLKKGLAVKKHQYSLQHHVEVHHPEVTNWQSLKVNLSSAPRTRRNTRPAAQTDGDDNEEDEDQDDEDNDGGNDNQDGGYAAGQDDDETESDSDSTRAKKRARHHSPSRPAPSGSARGKRPARAPVAGFFAEAPKMPSVPTAMVPILPIIAGPAQGVQVTVAQVPAHLSSGTDLRERNIQLEASNKDYRAVNENLRRQVSGLLRAITNAVAEDIHGFPLSTLAVQNSLMHFTQANGQLVEQILGRVTTELSARQPPQAPTHRGSLSAPAQTVAAQSVVSQPPLSTQRATPPRVILSSDSSLSDPPSDLESD